MKTVYDIGIEVKRAYMHVLADSPEEAFEIAKEHIDEWYDDFYFEHESDIEDCPTVVDCSENIYIDKDEDDPLYGSEKCKTLGDYINSEEEEEEEEETVDPNQLKLFKEGEEK